MGRGTPRARIAGECARTGRSAVVRGCVSILRGDEPDPALLLVLGGPPAPRMVAGESRADMDLWSRVWALRGLLWALDPHTADEAADAIVEALHDPAWRVREKAAQVVARHVVGVALPDVVSLRDADPVPRVRAAADRAVHRLTAAAAPQNGTCWVSNPVPAARPERTRQNSTASMVMRSPPDPLA